VQTEKGKGIIEFRQITGIFKIQIYRLFDFFLRFDRPMLSCRTAEVPESLRPDYFLTVF
jgi:hypothetical protein